MFEYEIKFCKRLGFPWKIVNNHFYWQTNISTGERYWIDDHTFHTEWYSREFFNEIKGEE